jgi:hypothetical protein
VLNTVSCHSLVIACIILLASCNDKRLVVEKIIKDNDTIVHRRQFDDDRQLILDESFKKDSIREGYYYSQDTNRIIVTGNYTEGKKNGSWHVVQDGDTLKMENWVAGYLFGEQLTYYPFALSGKFSAPYKYSFIGVGETKGCEIIYNEDGVATSITGEPVFINYSADNVKIGDEYMFIFFWGTPAGFTYDVHINEIGKDGEVISSKSYASDKDNESERLAYGRRALLTKIYKTAGEYRWVVQYTAQNVNGAVMRYSDTISLTVE